MATEPGRSDLSCDEFPDVPGPVPASATIPARAAFALGGLYLLLLLLASQWAAPAALWASALSIAVFVYFPLAIVYHGVRIPLSAAKELLAGLVAVGIWLGIMGLDTHSDMELIGPARNVALLVGAMFLGMLASRIVRDRNVLVPAAIVAALADLASVGWGLTGRALEQAPSLVTKLSVAVPTLTPAPAAEATLHHYPVIATMGVGDLFFVALFFAAAARFGLPLRRTFCWVFPLVVLAMLLTVLDVLPWKGIPGLPFIVMGFLTANSKSFHFSKEEWRAMAVAGGVLLAVVAVVVILRALMMASPM